MQSLIHDKIKQLTETKLTKSDRSALEKIRDIQMLIVIGSYLLVTIVSFYLCRTKGQGIDLDGKSFRVNFSSYDTSSLQKAMPVIAIGIFLFATVYAIWIYFRNIQPLLKDLKTNKKLNLSFNPEKIITDGQERYFISVPLANLRKIEVSKETFDDIDEGSEYMLSVASDSKSILGLFKEGIKVNYF